MIVSMLYITFPGLTYCIAERYYIFYMIKINKILPLFQVKQCVILIKKKVLPEQLFNGFPFFTQHST